MTRSPHRHARPPQTFGFGLAIALSLCWPQDRSWAADRGPNVAAWYHNLTHPAWSNPRHPLQVLARTGFLGATHRVVLLNALRETRPEHDLGVAHLTGLYSQLKLEPGPKRVAVLKGIETVLDAGKRPDDTGATLAASYEGVGLAIKSGVTQIGVIRPPTTREWWIAHQPFGSALIGAHGDLLHLTPVSLLHDALARWLTRQPGDTSQLERILASPDFKECLIPVWWKLGRAPPDPDDRGYEQPLRGAIDPARRDR